MHGDDFRLVNGHPLRDIMRNCCNDPRDLPGRKELRAQLVEALPDVDAQVIDALMTKAEEYAQAAVDPGARWDLRAAADELTLMVLKKLQAADRLVQVQEDEVDVSGAMDAIDSADPTQAGLRALNQALKAGEVEAAKRMAGS